MTTRPLVLLTNDDGFGAAGITWAQHALESAGAEVLVIAPDRNHTAGSHRITLQREISLVQVAHNQFQCAGTPADCVRIGVLSQLTRKPDLVVTGINHGANAGEDIRYSGTVSAAAEAAVLGLPAIALSQDADGSHMPFLGVSEPDTFPGADIAAQIALWAVQVGLPASTLLNVNFPKNFDSTSAVFWSTVGQRTWPQAAAAVLRQNEGEILVDPWVVPPEAMRDPGTDFAVLARGDASVNLLSVVSGLSDGLHLHSEWFEKIGTLLPGASR